MDATFTYIEWNIDWNVVFPLRTINFEGQDYPCPNDTDKYLTALYGDWKTPKIGADRVTEQFKSKANPETEPPTTKADRVTEPPMTKPSKPELARLKDTQEDTAKIHKTNPGGETEPDTAKDTKPGTASMFVVNIYNTNPDRDTKLDKTKPTEPGTAKDTEPDTAKDAKPGTSRILVKIHKTNPGRGTEPDTAKNTGSDTVITTQKANPDRDDKTNHMEPDTAQCSSISLISCIVMTLIMHISVVP